MCICINYRKGLKCSSYSVSEKEEKNAESVIVS